MGAFFHTTLYVPLYNLLVFLVGIVPGADFGFAVILATLVVRLVLWPLSMSAAKSQKAMKAMEPEMKQIRETYKNDKETEMKEMLALYKKYNIHPAAGLLAILIQLPIIIGLYWVFRTKTLPAIDTTILYPFVHAPVAVSVAFLGIASITSHSILLAVLAGLSQMAQAFYAVPVPPASVEASSAAEDMARAMAIQMRFVLPIVIGIAAYTSGAIALYLITTSLVSIFQEFIARQQKLKTVAVV
jgi:YidC/Oxa1 family membrane protein insertase